MSAAESTVLLDPRVALAAERTLLAWIRTGLALMGFGFVVARFGLFLQELAAAQNRPLPPSIGVSHWFGGALLVLGVVVNILAAVQHYRLIQQLEKGEQHRVRKISLGVILSMILAAIGLAMTAFLMSSGR